MMRRESVRRREEELLVVEVGSAGDGIDHSDAGNGGKCRRSVANAGDWPSLLSGFWVNGIEDAGEGGVGREVVW